MKKILVITLILIVNLTIAGEEPTNENELNETILTVEIPQNSLYFSGKKTKDIVLTHTAGIGTLSGLGLNFIMMAILGNDGEYNATDQMISSAMTELSTIGHAISGSSDALVLGGLGATLWATETLSNFQTGLYSPLSQSLYWAGNNLTMYKAYDSYATLRLRSGAWDNSNFSRYSYNELLFAPFDPEVFSKGYIWTAVAVDTVVGICMSLLNPNARGAAVWDTGKYFIGENEVEPAVFYLNHFVSPLINFPVGAVGEESLFRGYLRAELLEYMSSTWASVIDTTLFSVMHLVTDIARGWDWPEILLHQASVIFSNLLFNWVFDKDGLKMAVAVHSWSNIASNYAMGLMVGGAPSSRTSY